MAMDQKVAFGDVVTFLGELERTKLSLITVRDCACDWTWDKSPGGVQRVVSQGIEISRLGLAAAGDPWIGVSGTDIAELGSEEAVAGWWIWSNIVWEQLQCWWVAERSFRVNLLVISLGRLGSRRSELMILWALNEGLQTVIGSVGLLLVHYVFDLINAVVKTPHTCVWTDSRGWRFRNQ